MRHIPKKRGRMTRLGLVLLALIAALAMFVVACGDDDKDKEETPAAGKTAAPGGALKIGLLLDFTGDLSEFGPNMENGAKLAAKDINDAGGVNGQDIVLKRADSQTTPPPASRRRGNWSMSRRWQPSSALSPAASRWRSPRR